MNINQINALYFQRLSRLEKYLNKFHFETQLFDSGEDVPFPVLAMYIPVDDDKNVVPTHMAFTPLPEEQVAYTGVLQLSTDLDAEIMQKNRIAVLEFINEINGAVPIGHFVITNNGLCYRYMYPMSVTENFKEKSIVETFSLYILMFLNYKDTLELLSNGVIDVNEARQRIFKL